MIILESKLRRILNFLLNISLILFICVIFYSFYNFQLEKQEIQSLSNLKQTEFNEYVLYSINQRNRIKEFIEFLNNNNFKIISYEFNYSKGSKALVAGIFSYNMDIITKYSYKEQIRYDFKDNFFAIYEIFDEENF